jgi:hypothetical protein
MQDGFACVSNEHVSVRAFWSSSDAVITSDEFPISVYANGFGKPQSEESVPGTHWIIIVVELPSTETTDATSGCWSAAGMKRETVAPAGAAALAELLAAEELVVPVMANSWASPRERRGRRLRSDIILTEES